MDQQVGLRTQALNWRRVVSEDPDVVPTWVDVHYEADAGPLSRLPGLPSGIQGTLRGVREIRAGLGDVSRFDAVLWATWAAKSVPELVRAAPAALVMDMTPAQMEAMGAQYGYSRARARLGAGWKRRATDRLYAGARHLFPWNEWVAASLRDDYGVPADKITAVSPGVDHGCSSRTRPPGPVTAWCACCLSAGTSSARGATCCCAGRGRRQRRAGNCIWGRATRSRTRPAFSRMGA